MLGIIPLGQAAGDTFPKGSVSAVTEAGFVQWIKLASVMSYVEGAMAQHAPFDKPSNVTLDLKLDLFIRGILDACGCKGFSDCGLKGVLTERRIEVQEVK